MQKQDEKNEKIKNNDTSPEKTKTKNTVETQKKEYEKKQTKRKKKIKIAIIIGIIIFILFIFSIIFALLNMNSNKIISGISVNGIEISGLTVEEARGKLETIIAEKKNKQIFLKYNDFETEINAELMEVNYDIEGTIQSAYNVGRDNNIFVNNYNILFTLIGKRNINLEASLNVQELEKAIQDTSSKLPGAIKESSYYIEDDNLIITKGTKGVAIDINDTINKIKTRLNNINDNSQDYIYLTVIEKEPDAIDIEKIYNEVHTEAKNAYYTKDPFQVYPEVNGVDFNVEEAKEILKEDKEEYTIKLIITKPEVTIDQIGTEAFPERLSIFTTRYDASNTNRTTNLRLACEKINGKVLLAGETFSYNKTVGERTIAAGYKEAKIYSAGEVVDGLGGGICQISSTLYNAAVLANLEIVERRNHQFVTSYLPAGRDATVVYGLTDFKFKNTRKYPIRIIANVKSGIATIEMYGIKEDEEYTISIDTRTVGTTPYTTKYEDDASLAPGAEVVKQNGANGLQTETYITKSLDGKVVSRSLLSKDTYTPMQKIIRRSTKSAETSNSTETKVEQKVETKAEEKNDSSVTTKKEETPSTTPASTQTEKTNTTTTKENTTTTKTNTTKETKETEE